MKLALGTVQFGLPYGIAGRPVPVPEFEVRAILMRAWELGIRMLDTAAAYGDIERKLSRLMDGRAFTVVTKVPPMRVNLEAPEAVLWIDRKLNQARSRLGPNLHAVMMHRAEDLLVPTADVVWAVCANFASQHNVRLGVSCYDMPTLNALCSRYCVDVVQLPGNALDQRLNATALPQPAIDVHLRSAFLQGLLLMPQAEAAARLPSARLPLERWHAWCLKRELSPLVAALGLVKGFPHVSHCVVGVGDVGQLEAISEAWNEAPVLYGPELSVFESTIIDPRCWPNFQ